MKTSKGLLIILIIVLISFSGCSLNVSSDGLIRPPKTVGNEAQIQQLIDQRAEGDYLLKYPRNGSYRSAIIMEDINNDKTDEAIAFYRTQGDNPVTHLLVMENTTEGFKVSCDYKTQYSDIDSLEFADYDYDGNKEFFVGFATYTTGVNELCCFDYNAQTNKAEKVELLEFYSSFATGDFDKDGASEIMLLSLNTSDTSAEAKILDYDNNTLYTLESCKMDTNVTRFENISIAKIDQDNFGVVVDGFLSDSYNSQLIFYDTDKNLLINSFYNSEESTEKTHLVKAQDTNSDGIIEIPQLTACPLPNNAKNSIPAPIITWNNFNTKTYQFEEVSYCLTNFDFEYSFFLPDNYVHTTTALISKDSKTMNIYKYENNKTKDLLLTLKVGNSQEAVDFTVLTEYNNYSYGYQIPEGELPLYIDHSIIEKKFIIYAVANQNMQ